jgi:hypothetical protein
MAHRRGELRDPECGHGDPRRRPDSCNVLIGGKRVVAAADHSVYPFSFRAILPRLVRTTDSRHDFPIAPNLLARNFAAFWAQTDVGASMLDLSSSRWLDLAQTSP